MKQQYKRILCRRCGQWTNILGAGEIFELLVTLRLCTSCYAAEFLPEDCCEPVQVDPQPLTYAPGSRKIQ